MCEGGGGGEEKRISMFHPLYARAARFCDIPTVAVHVGQHQSHDGKGKTPDTPVHCAIFGLKQETSVHLHSFP